MADQSQTVVFQIILIRDPIPLRIGVTVSGSWLHTLCVGKLASQPWDLKVEEVACACWVMCLRGFLEQRRANI